MNRGTSLSRRHFLAAGATASAAARLPSLLRAADGAPAAAAIWAVADGIAVTGNVVTDASRRRMGYAAAMMRTGLAWAREAGATVASLNVAADNAAGLALYASLGYRLQYGYVYRYPGAA
jgi:ribosomal protein S18 acetylase RimI-like enzyme